MDMFRPAFCQVHGETTAHFVLSQNRLECSEQLPDGQPCGETRDGGPNEMWDPATLLPDCAPCPRCEGRGYLLPDEIGDTA